MTPLDDSAFAALMADLGPFEQAPGIAVGVSGGPDSMALALLLRAWTGARRGRLLALVVDHRLRAESTAEAAGVVARLEGLGIEARVLTREGRLPASALQATARAARYALLEAATAAAGFLHLATAHHRQDQRETVALRQAAGSGPRGLAGMPAVRELDRVRLIRPLLGVEPEQLKALLRQQGVAWLEDPANRDPRFWRARFRAATPAAGCTNEHLASQAAAARQMSERDLAAWLAMHARPHPLGFIAVPATTFNAAPHDLRLPLLARLVTATAGDIWPPDQAKLVRLLNWLLTGTSRRLALGGVLVERGGKGLTRFVREPRAVAEPAPLPPGCTLWDGRFRIVQQGAVGEATVAKAGPGWRARLAAGPARTTARLVPAVVLETLPLISLNDSAVALGPWTLAAGAGRLIVRFCPRSRYADVPFGQTMSASVASSRESLMYGKA